MFNALRGKCRIFNCFAFFHGAEAAILCCVITLDLGVRIFVIVREFSLTAHKHAVTEALYLTLLTHLALALEQGIVIINQIRILPVDIFRAINFLKLLHRVSIRSGKAHGLILVCLIDKRAFAS